MLRNYLMVGLRALSKSRAYALINIIGLAIGMAACLLILLFVRYERSFDGWLPDAERVFQTQTYYTSRETGETNKLQMAAYVTKGALLKDFPQIETSVYAQSTNPVVLKDGVASATEDFIFVDAAFFDVFKLPFVSGDARALSLPGTIVLSQSEAVKRFGTANPIGQTLTLVSSGKSTDFRVTAVIRDLPKNSHLKLNMIARVDFASLYSDNQGLLTGWGWQSGWLYLKLRPGADAAAMVKQFPAWEKRNIPTETNGDLRYNMGDEADFGLVNIRDVHLGAAQSGAMTPGNTAQSINTFAIVAALILAMACINFTNLSTARASQRAREVALRKVLGASRRQLIVQFIGESVLLAAIAMLLALAATELSLPYFADFLDADLALNYFGINGLLLPVLVLVLIVGVAGGLYPAVYLSQFQPARVLKANKSAADAQGSGQLRNLLVIGQFAISIGLIICSAVIYGQTVYARSADPGFNRNGLLQIENIGRRQLTAIAPTLQRQIAAIDGVVATGRTDLGIATGNSNNTGILLPGRKEQVTIGTYAIDAGFIQTMGIKLLAGRLFEENRPMDDATTPFPIDPAAERAFYARGVNVVINALAAKRMGYASPADAIGKSFKVSGDEEYGLIPATVIGVVADARFRSVRDTLDPIMFRFHRTDSVWLLVRYSGNPAVVRDKIEAVWHQLAPDVPFVAKFSDEIIGDLYTAEDTRAKIFAAFAALAVIVACLGLFGLAAFTAERRTKEIGIRKVLGARTRDIVRLLVWQFSRPVLIANLIAWPLAWWMMRDWLNGFDVRIALGPLPFISAGLLALAIAVATIGSHSYRVARTNPAQALRDE